MDLRPFTSVISSISNCHLSPLAFSSPPPPPPPLLPLSPPSALPPSVCVPPPSRASPRPLLQAQLSGGWACPDRQDQRGGVACPVICPSTSSFSFLPSSAPSLLHPSPSSSRPGEAAWFWLWSHTFARRVFPSGCDGLVLQRLVGRTPYDPKPRSTLNSLLFHDLDFIILSCLAMMLSQLTFLLRFFFCAGVNCRTCFLYTQSINQRCQLSHLFFLNVVNT